MAGIVDEQLEELRSAFPGAQVSALPDGSHLVCVPEVPLPQGWNRASTGVRFLAPVGYPMARPDCFWADDGLRLASGAMPQNSGHQQPPFHSGPLTWFSWHLGAWDAARDTLLTFVRVIQHRFHELR